MFAALMLTCPGPSTFDSKRSANYLGLRDPDSSKSLKTPAPTQINEPEEACSKAHLIYKKMCAYIALDYYNNKNDTKFELVEDETLDSYLFADFSGSWIHCCFNAKEDSSIKKFFAELQFVYPSGPAVTTCKIMIEGETQVGCENCKSVTHPVAGYRGGFLGNINHASYAMSDDDREDSPATTIEYPQEALSKANHGILFFSPATTVEYPQEALSKANHKQNEICANVALDYYDNKKDTKFELATYDTVTIKPFVPSSSTYRPDITFDPTPFIEKLCIRYRRFANRALDRYNKMNGTKFALVNVDSASYARFYGTWIHFCFNASDSSAVKLFFAEIKYDKFSEPAVTLCKIVEGETKDGCEYCNNKGVTHPVVGYRGDFVVEAEIDQKDKDACYKVYCEEFLGELEIVS